MMQVERVVGNPITNLKGKEGKALPKPNNLFGIDKDQLKDTMVISSTVAQLVAL